MEGRELKSKCVRACVCSCNRHRDDGVVYFHGLLLTMNGMRITSQLVVVKWREE